MNSFAKKVIRFLAAEDGPTSVEYAMMLMLVFLACLAVVNVLGQSTADNFESSSVSIQDALNTGP